MENIEEKEQGGNTMAARKKAAVKSEAAKAEVKEPIKAAEAKTDTKAAEETAKAVTGVKAAAVKTEAKAEVKTAAKEPAKKAASKPAKKTAVKKASATKQEAKDVKEEKQGTNIIVEYRGDQHKVTGIVDQIKAEWVAGGHRVSSIKSLDIYIQPENYIAYYVINGKTEGKVQM